MLVTFHTAYVEANSLHSITEYLTNKHTL